MASSKQPQPKADSRPSRSTAATSRRATPVAAPKRGHGLLRIIMTVGFATAIGAVLGVLAAHL